MRKNLTLAFLALGLLSSEPAFAQSSPDYFNQSIKVANNTGSSIAVNLTKDGSGYISKATWSGVGCDASGSYLTIAIGGYCTANVPWKIFSSFRMCAVEAPKALLAGPSSSYLNCSDSLANGLTTVELGTGGSGGPGLNYDITMIPQQPGADKMPCNDPQWTGVPYVASNSTTPADPGQPNYVPGGPYYYNQLKPGQVAGVTNKPVTSKTFCSGMTKVPYNFGVTLSCSGRKTFSCTGAPNLGIGFPANCGWTQAQFSANPSGHANCSGNSSTCYQAFWWPMSQGGPSAPTAPTTNGVYYGGYTNPAQPQDNCNSTLSDGNNPQLNVTFVSAVSVP